MQKFEEIRQDLINGYQVYLRNVSIDNVILGYHNKELKVLLQRPQGITKWTLPGGYIRRTESVEEAAKRIAVERTGISNLFLTQFRAFGNPGRTSDPNLSPELISRLAGIRVDEINWMFDYFVSLGFYTLTEFDKVKPNGAFFMEECYWWDVDELPPMLFDHVEIIKAAMKALRMHIYHFPISHELLPEKFTLPDIHALYETILDRKLDSRNFSKKLIATGIITKLNEKRNIGAHRSPYLYVYNQELYIKALQEGMALFL
ncbi:MAG: NUDIX hydrolase [Bacteroidales bacterium]|nr:NUDIX hydrolase [Bacteroidales bacterium]